MNVEIVLNLERSGVKNMEEKTLLIRLLNLLHNGLKMITVFILLKPNVLAFTMKKIKKLTVFIIFLETTLKTLWIAN